MAPPDLQRLRDRLKLRIVSDAPHNPDFNRLAQDLPSSDGTWPDIDYADRTRGGWSPRLHLLRIRLLSLRVANTGDKSLAGPILAALAKWIELDPLSFNWWHNQIGTPRLLADSLLMLGDHAPAALLAAARGILDRAGNFALSEADGVSYLPMTWTGTNRLWISANRLLTGALYGDEDLVGEALAEACGEMRIAALGEEGIQTDGSFHQHGPLLYNGGYGAAFLRECLFFLECTHGTRWEPARACHELLAGFILDGTRWMLRGADYNHGCRDREITRPHQTNAGLATVAGFLATTGVTRADELRDLAKKLGDGRAPGALAGNRLFYRSDFMVQQDARAALSVRMSSVRTVRSECVNSEGLRSHHLADGLTYLTATGAEYRDIFPVWDWQKLPGTTCLQTAAPPPLSPVARRGSSPLVGGVSDGSFGACGQTLVEDGLHAHKAWFFGPEGMVCLGAGIRGEGAVVTTFDQSLVQGPVLHDRAPAPLAPGRHDLDSIRWLSHGPWGFVFPQPTRVSISLGKQSGAWSLIGNGPADPVEADVFLACIGHGSAPAAAGYAYAVIPQTTPAALARLAASPTFVTAANHDLCQAVWWPGEQRLQAVFYAAGSMTWDDGRSLSVNRACCVQLQHAAAGRRILSLADITQEGESIRVELRAATGELKASADLATPTGALAGSTVTTDL